MKFFDRVKTTTTSTGTGAITCNASAASAELRTLASAGATVGDVFPYAIDLAGSAEWEEGWGTITAISSGAVTFSRTPTASSNANALVNFSAGTKEVVCTPGADWLNRLTGIYDTQFSQVVPLTQPGTTYMPQYTVAGTLSFSPAAGAVRGALVYLRLIADGVNMPSFAAFKEWGGSSGYDNRNGIVNVVQFFCDGVDVWHSITQAVGAVPAVSVPSAPTLGVASASDGAANFYYTAPSSNGGSSITGYSLTVYKAGDNSVIGTVPTTLANPIVANGLNNGVAVYGKLTAINSAGPSVQSAASNVVTPSAGAVTYARLSPMYYMTESGTGPFSYTGDGQQGYGSNTFGGLSPSLQSGKDGSIALVVGNYNTAGNEQMVGLLNPGWGAVAYAIFPCAFYTQGSTGKYVPFTNGNQGTATNSVSVANGDIMRMRRSGSTMIAEVSKDSGSTYTTIYTWTGITTDATKFQIMTAKSSQANNIVGVGLV